MTRRALIALAVLALVVGLGSRLAATPQQPAPRVPSFKSGVDLVRIGAVVRDRKGRFVKNLSAHDFEVLDGGQVQRITDFQLDRPGLSIALLMDISGSMEARMESAHEAATHVLSGLDGVQDEAAVFTFDTELEEVEPFAVGLRVLPEKLAAVRPFGATSLHDAIAATAKKVGEREGRRRAVIVMTDGADTASRLKPADVSAIASAIDVPVYIFGMVAGIDNPAADEGAASSGRALGGSLDELATWTGGRVFITSTPGQRSLAARQTVDELRHQYLIAFESSGKPGWHPLVVRARDKDLSVRARNGYIAGQSRPQSF
jgi:Ca-activated chloride channel family protein